MRTNETVSKRRILNELRGLRPSRQESWGISVLACREDDIHQLQGEIEGPVDTPYYGGKFKLDIRLPREYPLKPPIIRFKTKVWHPNISSATGAICLDVLWPSKWTVTQTLKTALISIQGLLTQPEPDSPQDAVVADQFIEDYEMFVNTAKLWTHHFAGGEKSHSKELDEILAEFQGLTFTDDQEAIVALSNTNWDPWEAMEYLEEV